MIFEFTDTKVGTTKRRKVLVIGDKYRAYEQADGSVVLNDESQGCSFFPEESYAEFSKRLLTHQHFIHE